MNTYVISILVLVWLHFIADFIAQSDKMAQMKSKSLKWLSLHCVVYTAHFLLFGWKFAVLNGVLHFIVDFFTSRATSYLWKAEKRHWFFVCIGFDQALHMSILILTSTLTL